MGNRVGYAGYRDWRVPTKKELQTLIYCSSSQPNTWNDTGQVCQGGYERPTIYQPVFPNTPDSRYWSSDKTSYNNAPWSVSFGNGFVGASSKLTEKIDGKDKDVELECHVRLVGSKR